MMEEKFGAIWINVEQDDSARVIFEEYLPSIDKLHVVYQQANGCFVPCSFVREADFQWRLPIWSKENEKAMLPTLESAKEYLGHYGANR